MSRIGMDSAIFFTVTTRLIQAGGGFISMVLIAKFLTASEQGYYFTFGSILAIQIFFELGLSTIITQFVAHEVAVLEWKNDYVLAGNEVALSRLSSLLRFCIKWFFVLSVILLAMLIISGYFFFKTYGDKGKIIEWHTPWVILSASTSCSLLISPVLAYLQGLGKIVYVAKVRLAQQVAQIFVLYSGLFFGLKLYASPISAFVSFLVSLLCLALSRYGFLLKSLWNNVGQWVVRYKEEIFPYQWRIALSWMSGYFMYQLFNPVIFAKDGAVAAGQMGMSLAALNGILAISLSWTNTKVPIFSVMIARKDYRALDHLFNKTVKQSSFITVISLLVFIGSIKIFEMYRLNIANRFLPVIPLVLLCITTFSNQLTAAFGTYLRCHKKEPLLVYSIVLAILTAISTLVLGRLYGTNGIVAGYFFITVFLGFLWIYHIFRKKKLAWHL